MNITYHIHRHKIIMLMTHSVLSPYAQSLIMVI